MHSDLFADVSRDCRDWPLIVDADDRPFMQTIGVPVDPGDIPVVDSSRYAKTVAQANEKGRNREHHSNKSEKSWSERFLAPRREKRRDLSISYRP